VKWNAYYYPQIKKWVILFIIYYLCIGFDGLSLARDVAVIRIDYRDAHSLLSVVEGVLSDEGAVSVDERTNALVVLDNDANIRKIRILIKQYDFPVAQAKITVRFKHSGTLSGHYTSAYGAVSGDDWQIGAGSRQRRDGIGIRHSQINGRQQSDSEFFINVSSGSRAYIKTGQDIPFTERWMRLYHRYGSVSQTTVFKKIETGMDVKPVITGNRVHIEITPRISHLEQSGQRKIVHFATTSTRLTVPLGQWISIGGSQTANNEIMNAILMREIHNRNTHLSISMKVEKN